MNNNLMGARCRAIGRAPWYGAIISRFNWIRCDNVGTIGVNVPKRGVVNCYYCDEFVDKIFNEDDGINKLVAILCHEVEHIIRMHCYRNKFLESDHSKLMWNIAADWVINGKKSSRNIENLPDHVAYIPENDKIWGDLSTLPENGTTEEYYYWIVDNTKYHNGILSTKIDKIIEIVDLDNHDIWGDSTSSKEEMRQTASNLARVANNMHAGKCPGGLIDSINKLNKPQQNWLYKWKNILGRAAGSKRKTYSRLNKRKNSFGIKGTSRRSSIPLVIGVDTSGSMSTKMLERVFTEVESMSSFFKITLVQFDCQVTSVSEYHKNDWKGIKIKGRGGTCFESFFKHIEEHKMIGKMNCIITDGYCEIPETKKYPVTWVVIGRDGKKYLENQGIWGDLVLIEHDYE